MVMSMAGKIEQSAVSVRLKIKLLLPRPVAPAMIPLVVGYSRSGAGFWAVSYAEAAARAESRFGFILQRNSLTYTKTQNEGSFRLS